MTARVTARAYTMHLNPQQTHAVSARQNGVALIIVLLLLVIISMLGIASVQIATMGERGARNDRDMQLAWQSAEAALADAQIDIAGPNASVKSRTSSIAAVPPVVDSGCLTSNGWRGFCNTLTVGQTKPTWLVIDFTDTSASAPSVPLGTYTDRVFASAGQPTGTGIQPSLAPRYIIEDITTSGAGGGGMVGTSYQSAGAAGTKAALDRLYRITAMGFGPRSDVQAVLQTVYRN